MKIKTAELIGRQLDYAVALSAWGTGFRYDTIASYWITIDGKHYVLSNGWSEDQCYTPSTNWLRGGPIIEREGIELLCNLTATEAARFSTPGVHADWQAFYRNRRMTEERSFATTPLIAAMRCYCASKLGDTVEIPEELK